METVGKLLGHEDLKTTQLYAKVVDSKKEEAISKLDYILEGQKEKPKE